ncbi:septum formation initiator family protein [Shimazuella kribbensis]|uniref:septum formation initiator family protein n=1 Tax=Shimazuella kribbensis TaxID=139808 RepID=UPI0004907197|nr:septum formation initiator family protein [Shimazuella kribbensis]
MNLNNNVLRFRSPEPTSTEPKMIPKSLPPKLHPKVKRRRIAWLVLMVLFFCWCVTQLVMQEIKISKKEELLHTRQQELATSEAATRKLTKDVKKFQDKDYLMEQAHKHGYGKPGEKNMKVDNE